MTTRYHPMTGAPLTRGTRSYVLNIRSSEQTIDLPGWYAVDDLTGEHGLHDADDMQVSDDAIDRLKNQRAGHSDHQAIEAQIDQIIVKE